jgi:HEAT repeat protein
MYQVTTKLEQDRLRLLGTYSSKLAVERKTNVRIREILLVTTIICILGLFGIHTASADITENLERLQSDSREERERTAQALLRERDRTIAELLRVAKASIHNREKKGTAKTAIILLGKLGAREAIPFLIENLGFEDIPEFFTRVPTAADLHPCGGALTEIGLPSLEPLLKMAQETDNQKRINATAFIVYRVLGGRVGTAYVEERLEGQKDPIRRQRLLKVKQLITDVLPKLPLLP